MTKSEKTQKNKPRRISKFNFFRLVITLVLLTLASAILLCYSNISWGGEKLPSKFEAVINECDAADLKLIDDSIAELNQYFDQVDGNLDSFLDDLFSLKSKAQMFWYMVKDLKWELPAEYSPYLMMLAMVPHREGQSLEAFLEEKFDAHFGGVDRLEQALETTISSIGFELRRNNSQLEMEIGELLAEDMDALNHEGKSATQCIRELRNSIRGLSGTLVSNTSGVQVPVEIAGVAADIWLAPAIGTFLMESGVIAEGLATTITTFGIGIVIALGVDIVANEIARDNLRPKIEEALIQWRLKTIARFREKMMDKLTDMHMTRRLLIEKILSREITRQCKDHYLIEPDVISLPIS